MHGHLQRYIEYDILTACLPMRYLNDSSDWTFCSKPVTSFPNSFSTDSSQMVPLIEEFMVAWIKSFENSLQDVLGKDEADYQLHLKSLHSPR